MQFVATDNLSENAVTYEVRAFRSNLQLASRRGKAGSGAVSLTLRFRSTQRVRTLRIVIEASDPLENRSEAVRVVRLPR